MVWGVTPRNRKRKKGLLSPFFWGFGAGKNQYRCRTGCDRIKVAKVAKVGKVATKSKVAKVAKVASKSGKL